MLAYYLCLCSEDCIKGVEVKTRILLWRRVVLWRNHVWSANKMCLWYMFLRGHLDALGYFSPKNPKPTCNSFIIFTFTTSSQTLHGEVGFFFSSIFSYHWFLPLMFLQVTFLPCVTHHAECKYPSKWPGWLKFPVFVCLDMKHLLYESVFLLLVNSLGFFWILVDLVPTLIITSQYRRRLSFSVSPPTPSLLINISSSRTELI